MKFLLALATRYYNEELVRLAVNFTKQKDAVLSVLFVLDEELTRLIIDQLIDVGFIGEKPSAELRAAVINEYASQAKEQIGQIKKIGAEVGIDVDTEIKQGDFVSETMAKAIDDAVDLIILNRERQGAIAKILKSSAVDKLIRNAPCEVKVFES